MPAHRGIFLVTRRWRRLLAAYDNALAIFGSRCAYEDVEDKSIALGVSHRIKVGYEASNVWVPQQLGTPPISLVQRQFTARPRLRSRRRGSAVEARDEATRADETLPERLSVGTTTDSPLLSTLDLAHTLVAALRMTKNGATEGLKDSTRQKPVEDRREGCAAETGILQPPESSTSGGVV